MTEDQRVENTSETVRPGRSPILKQHNLGDMTVYSSDAEFEEVLFGELLNLFHGRQLYKDAYKKGWRKPETLPDATGRFDDIREGDIAP